MEPIDLDTIIRNDLPAIRQHNRSGGIIDPKIIVDLDFPYSVSALYLDLINKNQCRFKAGMLQNLQYAEYISLIYHASKKRDMGGSYHIHPHSVAKSIVQAGNDPYYTVIAALTHDIIEQGKPENSKIIGNIRKLISGFNVFASNRPWEQEYLISVYHDLIKVGIVLDRLTRRRREDYFNYIKRALSPKIRLGPVRGFISRKNPVNESVDEIIQSTLVVKLRDRWHNTLTLDAYDPPKQLYEIYKNMVLLSHAKKMKHTKQLVRDNAHYNDLIDASIDQISKIIAKLEFENPDIKNNRLIYEEAFRIYDKAGGLNKATRYGETKLPKRNKPEILGIAEMIDCTMSRYANYIHDKVERPQTMDPKRLYVDCFDFTMILQKLKDYPGYAPEIMFSKRKTAEYLRSMPRALM